MEFMGNDKYFSKSKEDEQITEQILKAINRINYGSVEIVIHASKIVQIECREKIRWDKKSD